MKDTAKTAVLWAIGITLGLICTILAILFVNRGEPITSRDLRAAAILCVLAALVILPCSFVGAYVIKSHPKFFAGPAVGAIAVSAIWSVWWVVFSDDARGQALDIVVRSVGTLWLFVWPITFGLLVSRKAAWAVAMRLLRPGTKEGSAADTPSGSSGRARP